MPSYRQKAARWWQIRDVSRFSQRLPVRKNPSLQRLRVEPLEDRRMLSVAAPQVELFSVSPALFVENQGQWAEESVRFMHQGDDAAVAMTDEGILFDVSRHEDLDGVGDATRTLEFSAGFVGANTVVPLGLEQTQTAFNYFVGDEATWRAGVMSYEVVAYQGLYDGIDLMTWGLRNSLKYEFHVAPGADGSQIAVRYDGIAGLSLAEDGSLVVDLGGDWGSLTDDAPYIYQVIDGQQVEVAGQFVLLDSHSYTFAINGEYDPTVELVIDPNLAWATYLGGSGYDRGYGVAADAAGNAFLTGGTDSTNFAGRLNTNYGGQSDAFVAKVTPTGSVSWMTYLGGGEDDYGRGIALDASGNILATGATASTNFAGATNAYCGGNQDGFVAKVNANGSLAWATYLGGSDFESGYGVAADALGNALVLGTTSSTDFVGRTNTYCGGDWDAFVVTVASNGAVAWAAYFGGGGADYGEGIAMDAAGNALVAGWTDSTDFVGRTNTYHGGYYDAYVAKLTTNGSVAWTTYLGGSGSDLAWDVAVNAVGNATVIGETDSTDLAGRSNSYLGGNQDAFLAKVTPDGSLVWARYLGGNDFESGGSITVNATGHMLVTGGTRSGNFEKRTNSYHGGYDAFVAMVTPSGSVVWATYLGGSNFDTGLGVAVDASGNALVTGGTWSTNFEGRNNTYKGGDADAFLVKMTATAMPAILGDANGDGAVNDLDATILASHWHQAGVWADGDFNDDGRVDDRDASIMAAHWSSTVEAQTPVVNITPPIDEPVAGLDARFVGPRQAPMTTVARRRIEPSRAVERAATLATAHDIALAETLEETELLDYRLAWSYAMTSQQPQRRKISGATTMPSPELPW